MKVSLPCSQEPITEPDESETLCNVSILGEGLLVPCPIPNLEAHPLSAVRECLFNMFTSTLYNTEVSRSYLT
jgi:hypothetical protein